MMQVKKCWQKVLNTVISIVAAMVFLAVGNCNVATANCGWSDVCEPRFERERRVSGPGSYGL